MIIAIIIIIIRTKQRQNVMTLMLHLRNSLHLDV